MVRKGKSFSLGNYNVAFVKKVIASDTFAHEVIKCKHLEDVSDSPMQSRLINIYLFRHQNKKTMHLHQNLSKSKFDVKMCMLTRKGWTDNISIAT